MLSVGGGWVVSFFVGAGGRAWRRGCLVGRGHFGLRAFGGRPSSMVACALALVDVGHIFLNLRSLQPFQFGQTGSPPALSITAHINPLSAIRCVGSLFINHPALPRSRPQLLDRR